MTTTRCFRVTGKVQGVGFRAFVLGVAKREGLIGYVHNLTSGSVEGVVHGQTKAVLRFEDEIRVGPVHAVVSEIITKETENFGFGTDFVVR